MGVFIVKFGIFEGFGGVFDDKWVFLMVFEVRIGVFDGKFGFLR
jgi:hypothetical protein